MFPRAPLRFESSVLTPLNVIEVKEVICISISLMHDSMFVKIECTFIVHQLCSCFVSGCCVVAIDSKFWVPRCSYWGEWSAGTPEWVTGLKDGWAWGGQPDMDTSWTSGSGVGWVKLVAMLSNEGTTTSEGTHAFAPCWKSSWDVQSLFAWELRSGLSLVSVRANKQAPRESTASLGVTHSTSFSTKDLTAISRSFGESPTPESTCCKWGTLWHTGISFPEGLCGMSFSSTLQQQEQQQEKVASRAGMSDTLVRTCKLVLEMGRDRTLDTLRWTTGAEKRYGKGVENDPTSVHTCRILRSLEW